MMTAVGDCRRGLMFAENVGIPSLGQITCHNMLRYTPGTLADNLTIPIYIQDPQYIIHPVMPLRTTAHYDETKVLMCRLLYIVQNMCVILKITIPFMYQCYDSLEMGDNL